MSLIPEGTWRGCATTYEWGWTSQDKEQLGVQLVFSPNQDPEVDGRTLTWYASFSEKATKFTLKTLRTLGWQGDDLSDLSDIIDANEVDIVVAHEPDYNDPDQMRARVRFINPIGAGGIAMRNKMLPEQVAAFAARMRGEVLAAAKPAPAAQPVAAPTTKAAPPPSAAAKRARAAVAQAQTAASDLLKDDSDIPF